MKNREIRLMRTIYWPACGNKNERDETNPHLIGGVPAGTEGELVFAYESPSWRNPDRMLRFWEFKPKEEKYRPYGGRFMTMDDRLYDEFMNGPNDDVPGHMMRLNNLEIERQEMEEQG